MQRAVVELCIIKSILRTNVNSFVKEYTKSQGFFIYFLPLTENKQAHCKMYFLANKYILRSITYGLYRNYQTEALL